MPFKVHRNDFQRITGQQPGSNGAAAIARAADVTETNGQSSWSVNKESFIHHICQHRGVGYQAENVQNDLTSYHESTVQVETLFAGLAERELKSSPQLAAVTS